MVLLYAKALLDLDVGWDNLNYHLPFAAMRSGIFGDEFKFSGWLTGFYDGFPPLQDLISGYLWKLTRLHERGQSSDRHGLLPLRRHRARLQRRAADRPRSRRLPRSRPSTPSLSAAMWTM